MQLSGWGNNIKIDSTVSLAKSPKEAYECFSNSVICRGMGRSYGDSSLHKNVICTSYFNNVVSFDTDNGIIEVESGVLVSTLLENIIPKGWFLPVTPGTSRVSIGGLIASDIHGKNHHINGCISDHIISFDIMVGSGEIITASRLLNFDLFRATCGGMGLTGLIIKATIKLKKISSTYINKSIKHFNNLNTLITEFEFCKDSEYRLAWLDINKSKCIQSKSIFISGNHSDISDRLIIKNNRSYNANYLLENSVNIYSSTLFNKIYYLSSFIKRTRKSDFYSFFYPLDIINNWNKLYGKSGLIQLQFVLPQEDALKNIISILSELSRRGEHSNLTVMKFFGSENNNFISFPKRGITLALDFKATIETVKNLEYIHKMIVNYNGRVYLTKDSIMTKDIFQNSYPLWEDFEKVRNKYHAIGIFESLQSRRIGLG